MSLLNPMLELAKVLESVEPGAYAGVHPSEMFIISFLPQAPGGGQENLDEKRVLPCTTDRLEEGESIIE